MATHTQPRRRRTLGTPGTLALARAGGNTLDLAAALGVSRTSAAYYLAGERRMPERMPAALAELVGADAAEAVLAAIPQHKSEGVTVAPS